MISFIIPAHNEALWIGECLASIRASMEKLGEPYELIVVDDASTDTTRQIAESAGARTFGVQCRKVSAVRNAGAREARGEVFFFVCRNMRPRTLVILVMALLATVAASCSKSGGGSGAIGGIGGAAVAPTVTITRARGTPISPFAFGNCYFDWLCLVAAIVFFAVPFKPE